MKRGKAARNSTSPLTSVPTPVTSVPNNGSLNKAVTPLLSTVRTDSSPSGTFASLLRKENAPPT